MAGALYDEMHPTAACARTIADSSPGSKRRAPTRSLPSAPKPTDLPPLGITFAVYGDDQGTSA